MQALTIDAATQETARSMLDALADFDPQLVETVDGRFQVVVAPLAGSDRRIVEVLNARRALCEPARRRASTTRVRGARLHDQLGATERRRLKRGHRVSAFVVCGIECWTVKTLPDRPRLLRIRPRAAAPQPRQAPSNRRASYPPDYDFTNRPS